MTNCRTGKSGAGLDPRKKRRKNIASDWRWTNTGEAVLVKVETTRQTETSNQLDDVVDVQSDLTDGQSLQLLVDHRPRWKIHWQKHSELQSWEVDRILKQRTLEPDEDPETLSRHLWKTP